MLDLMGASHFGEKHFFFECERLARVLYKAREFPTALQMQNPDAPDLIDVGVPGGCKFYT